LPAKNNVEAFKKEVTEISQKFMDSLQLTCGIWFGEHNRNVTVPENCTNFLRYGEQIVFVLVIKNRKGNLVYIADMIKQLLLKEHRLWRFEIVVLNEDDAFEKKLVIHEEQ